MRLLALDASTTAVGWSVFEDGEYQESGVFLPKNADWRERISEISTWLSSQLDLIQPDAVAYEIPSGNRGNMRTHCKLGAVEWACWRQGNWWTENWIEVNVQAVKQSGCHKHALPMARAISGKALDGGYAGDEADAIGTALAALAELRKEKT